MRKFAYILTICIMFVPAMIRADIYSIDVQSIPNYSSLEPMINELYENLKYYHIWQRTWSFENPREKYIDDLKKLYGELVKVGKKGGNIELELLMGEVAHFLYNLDVKEYYQLAIDHYNRAGKINKSDYRPLWFLGRHYSLADKPKDGMAQFMKVTDGADPEKIHPTFWEEYAFAATLAFMPSNAIMGMDYARKISGKVSYYESVAGKNIRSTIMSVPNSTKVDDKDQWKQIPGEDRYINRLFGMRINLPAGWKMKTMNGGNKIAVTTMLVAPETRGKAGKVTYSFTVIATLPEKDKGFEEEAESLVSVFKDFTVRKITIDSPYKNTIAYEVINPSLYASEGGGHTVMFFIERDEPEFPGAQIEVPVVIPPKSVGELEYIAHPKVYARYKGKIRYLILMDTCESVFKISKESFDKLLHQIIVIE